MKKYLLCLLMVLFLAFFTLPSHADTLWEADFSTFTPPANVSVFTSYCWDMGNHLVLYSRDSYITMTFNLPEGNYSNYKFLLTDRGTVITMAMAEQYASGIYSPYTITVNKSTVAEDVDVIWLQDKTTTYNIGNYLKPGKNTITLTLNTGSNTRYEIRKIQLLTN